MFNSVFSRRKVQKKFYNLTQSRRAQSPPSPASFASPDVHENDLLRLHDQSFANSEVSLKNGISPQVQLSFDHRESISDWFPTELLRVESSALSPPQRNVSLPMGYVASNASGSTSRFAGSSREAINYSRESIIIIEPERNPPPSSESDTVNSELQGLDVQTEFEDQSQAEYVQEQSPTPPRRPAPTPIKIPDNLTPLKIEIQRSASAGPSAGPRDRLLPDSQTILGLPSTTGSACSEEPSSTISGTSLARALVASSFIVSNEPRNSRFRHGVTRQDSATLPRGDHLFLYSPYWKDKRISGGEVVYSPDYVLGSPVPPVPPMPSSAELSSMSLGSGRMRRRSTSSIGDILTPQSEDLPSTPGTPNLRHKRTISLTRLPKEQIAMKRFSRISEASSPAPSPTTPGVSGVYGDTSKMNRSSQAHSTYGSSVSKREASANGADVGAGDKGGSSKESPSSLHETFSSHDDEHDQESHVERSSEAEADFMLHDGVQSDEHSPILPRAETSGISPVHSHHSAPTSGDKRSFTFPFDTTRSPGSGSLAGSSSSDSPGPTFSVFRSRSETGAGRNGGNPVTLRPIVLLPIGERPHSALVPQTASPLTARTTSDEMLRQKLPFRPSPAVPVTARLSSPSPMDSPDLLDFMFPVAKGNISRQISRNRVGGRQPAPITVPSSDEDVLSTYPASSIPSSALHQTFPETPYAFSPLMSAGFVPPPLPTGKTPRTMKSLNHGAGKRSARVPLTPRHIMRSPSTGQGYGASMASRSALASQPPLTPPHTADSLRSINSDPGAAETNPMRVAQAKGLASLGVGLLPSIEERSSAPSSPRSNLTSPKSTGQMVSPLSQVFSPPTSANFSLSENTHTSRSNSASPKLHTDPVLSTESQSSLRSASPTPGSPPPAQSKMTSSGTRSQTSSPFPRPPISPNIPSRSTPPHSRGVSPSNHARTHPNGPQVVFATPFPVIDTPPLEITSESSRSTRSSRSSRRISSLDLSHSDNIVIPAKRTLTPLPSPLPRSRSLSNSPSPSSQVHSQADEIRSLIEDTPPESNDLTLPPYHEQPTTPPGPLPPPYPTESPEIRSRRYPPGRSRPAPPSGPRRPSGPTLLQAANRARQGSIASINSRGPAAPVSASLPKFQTTPIKFRGLTMDAAQWTFSSSQLQEIVSKAIKTSAEASAIRLLPIDTFNDTLPNEIRKLEGQSSELRTNYKLNVRKRRGLINQLSGVVDGGELSDPAAACRLVEELSEVSDNLDHMSEELYNITDQLAQLNHLRDLHSTSALAMAVRKLNRSFIRHLAEKEILKQQLIQLEAERDEAWIQAQEVAQEYDDLYDKVTYQNSPVPNPPTPFKDSSSRRSSRISIARKTSMRATKAGLRSPSRRRGSRSSIGSSLHGSTAVSPTLRSAPGTGDIPPLPPIPRRTPLGIITTDLPIRSPGITSDVTPTSEVRAMLEAQKELCEMLGISVEDLQGENLSLSARPRSAATGFSLSTASPRTRRNSETFNNGRPLEMYGTSEDRAAILAAIGMVSHEI